MSRLKALLGGVPVGDEYPVRIMAVLNLSPESFYKESVAVVNAVERAGARETRRFYRRRGHVHSPVSKRVDTTRERA
mgnify:CR=1 FL=1